MDLRSGTSLWPALDPAPPRAPALERDESCEIAVIGAGITGALIADVLTAAGHDCLLLDRRAPAKGSTAASTAIVQYELDTSLVELAACMGDSDATLAYQLCARAVEDLIAIGDSLPARCRLTRRPSLYLASTDKDAAGLEPECRARRAAGLDVELLSRRQIESRFPFSRPAALLSSLAAEADPYAITLALLSRAESRGLRRYADTTVLEIESSPNCLAITTDRGPVVRARRAILATGYETVPSLRRWASAKLTSTYAVATAPLPSLNTWPDRCVIWETARPYFYARTTRDRRAVIGGEDVNTADPDARDALIAEKAAELIARLNHLFPGLNAQPEFAWAGTFGQSPDGLAYIGEPPGAPGILMAVGLGGNGTTFAMIAAQFAAAWAAGRDWPGAHLFSLERSRDS